MIHKEDRTFANLFGLYLVNESIQGHLPGSLGAGGAMAEGGGRHPRVGVALGDGPGLISLSMPAPREVLDLLSRDELLGLVDEHGMIVGDRRIKAHLLDRPEDKGPALRALLAGLSRDRLKELCVVNDIDTIVRLVRFPGWQQASAGVWEVKKALRKTLFKYQLHQDEELFEKAYADVKQYY